MNICSKYSNRISNKIHMKTSKNCNHVDLNIYWFCHSQIVYIFSQNHRFLITFVLFLCLYDCIYALHIQYIVCFIFIFSFVFRNFCYFCAQHIQMQKKTNSYIENGMKFSVQMLIYNCFSFFFLLVCQLLAIVLQSF